MIIKLIFVNLLTILRLIGTIILIPILKKYGTYTVAILTLLIYFTDVLDGVLARKWKVSTFFGAIFDCIADKLFNIMNFIVLYLITPYSLFCILIELLIVIIQLFKFKKHLNIQSNIFGKIKMWFLAFSIILAYLVSAIDKLTFLSQNIINYIHNCNQERLYLIILLPAIIMEIITLLSYIIEIGKPSNAEALKIEEGNKKRIKLKGKNKIIYFKDVWFNPKFYEEHKNDINLRDLRKLSKENIR